MPSSPSLLRAESSSMVSVASSSSTEFSAPFQAGKFMVDSGSPITIIPAPDVSQPSVDSGLRDASGNIIRTYGKRLVNIPIDGKVVPFEATCCNVVRPILGRDFFKGPGKDMLLDLSQDKIVNRINGYHGSPLVSDNSNSVCALSGTSLNPYARSFRTTASLDAARKEATRLVKIFDESQGPDD
ncbi:hypothetical protein DJ031_00210, partial, partial [Paramuricea clavata]